MNARKMTMEIAQLGCGIHPERYVLYYPLNNSSKVSEDVLSLIQQIADSHYEADFIIGTTAEKIDHKLQLDEDNIYLVTNLSDENELYLNGISKIVVSEKILAESNRDDLVKEIGENMLRENFTRDETTKQAKFKITTSDAGDKTWR
jgi:hypothetical protein